MKTIAEPPPDITNATAIEIDKSKFAIGITVGFALLAVLLWPSTASILEIWTTSNTYLYSVVIPPLSLVLLLRLEKDTHKIHLTGWVDGFSAVGIFAVIWLLGRMLEINFIHHVAFAGLGASSIAVVAGAANARNWIFPLGFLLLTAPAGSVFQPALQSIATNVTVFLLSATGFAIEQNGSIITTSAGRFDITPACAGLNFLLAAIVTGTLVSHLAFKSIQKSLIFLSLCVAIAIICNWLRIYLIIVAATLSDMSLGIGADHLWFGWVFFAGVLSILIWRAKRYADLETSSSRSIPPTKRTHHPMLLAFFIICILISVRLIDYFFRSKDLVSQFPIFSAFAA